MLAPLTPEPAATKNRPGASRPAVFAVALGSMLLGAVVGMIVARAVVGNPWLGGPHGGGLAAQLKIYAAMPLGLALGAVAWFVLTTGPRSPLSFLLASLVAGMAACASYGLWGEFDQVSFFRGQPDVSFSVASALSGAIAFGPWGLVSGVIVGIFGVICIMVSNACRRPGAGTHGPGSQERAPPGA